MPTVALCDQARIVVAVVPLATEWADVIGRLKRFKRHNLLIRERGIDFAVAELSHHGLEHAMSEGCKRPLTARTFLWRLVGLTIPSRTTTSA
jgi:hypothetical protein